MSLINKISIFLATITVSLGLAATTLAQGDKIGNVGSQIESVGKIVENIVAIVVTLIFLVFFWNLVEFIYKGSDGDEGSKRKKKLLWSLIAVVIATSLWGIVAFVNSIVGIDQNTKAGNITLPTFTGNR